MDQTIYLAGVSVFLDEKKNNLHLNNSVPCTCSSFSCLHCILDLSTKKLFTYLNAESLVNNEEKDNEWGKGHVRKIIIKFKEWLSKIKDSLLVQSFFNRASNYLTMIITKLTTFMTKTKRLVILAPKPGYGYNPHPKKQNKNKTKQTKKKKKKTTVTLRQIRLFYFW